MILIWLVSHILDLRDIVDSQKQQFINLVKSNIIFRTKMTGKLWMKYFLLMKFLVKTSGLVTDDNYHKMKIDNGILLKF